MKTTNFNNSSIAVGKFKTSNNGLVFAYALSLLIVIAAIIVSYAILRDTISTQKDLNQLNSHIRNAQFAITDSSNLLSDYRSESKKNNANDRLLQIIANRIKDSVKTLDSIDSSIQSSSEVFRETAIWPDISWIAESTENSLNLKLNSYTGQINSLFDQDGSTKQTKAPPIPIEAAGARNGALFLGFQQASEQVSALVDINSTRVERVHKVLTSFIVVVMLLISALIVVPLWYRLVSEHRRLESAHSKLYSIAYTDRQTDLPNLDGLEKTLPTLAGFEDGHILHCLLLVRISNLDQIYNLIGSHRVDGLLQNFSARLKQFEAIKSQWSRSGEPEFCCLLPEDQVQKASLWIQQFHDHLTQRLIIDGIIVRTEVCLATSRIDDTNLSRPNLLSDHLSNARLASAEFKPPEQWIPQHNTAMNEALVDQNNLIERIADGLAKNQFLPYYQLKVDAKTGRYSSLEVLTRWKLDDGTIEPPFVFIPVAESSGLIVDMTFTIFDQVLADIKKWSSNNIAIGHVAINIAREVLLHPELPARLQSMLDQLPDSCAGLEVEVTENIALEDNFERTCEILSNIRSMGVLVSIDDFGTGYASLQTLIDLPFDILKIDRAFVIPMTESGSGNEVVSAMISLSNTLKKACVIEGVETEWQWRLLEKMGADELQGFHFHKPAEASEVEATLRNGTLFRSVA